MAGGLAQGAWGLGRVSKGLGGWTLRGRDGRSLVQMCGNFPLFYRLSSPSGPLPKRVQTFLTRICPRRVETSKVYDHWKALEIIFNDLIDHTISFIC